GQRQRAVKVREQVAAAGCLPFQRPVEHVGIDCNQQQIRGTGKMLGRSLADLGGGREMDEAVAGVDGGTEEHPGPLRLAPKLGFQDFVDGLRHAVPESALKTNSSKPRLCERPQAPPDRACRFRGSVRRTRMISDCWLLTTRTSC